MPGIPIYGTMIGMQEFKLYSLGTGNRSEEDFLSILKYYQIHVVADVRSYPNSARLHHFRMDHLTELLADLGIHYEFLGKELGGFRKGSYLSYTRTLDFQEGVNLLLEYGHQGNAVMICSEVDPFSCHRRFIAQSLKDKNVRVQHILGKDNVLEDNPQLDLFG
jgi:uncharacterized protein (DUF488 family)